MEHIYGVPALTDSDPIGSIGQWSRALARTLAARDAAIVRGAGTIPEGDPASLESVELRVTVLEDTVQPGLWIDLPLTSPWAPYATTGTSYYSGARARRTAAGVQIQGMVKGSGANTEICSLPAGLIPEFGGHFPAISNSEPATVFVSTGGQVRYLSGGAPTSYLSINLILPLP